MQMQSHPSGYTAHAETPKTTRTDEERSLIAGENKRLRILAVEILLEITSLREKLPLKSGAA